MNVKDELNPQQEAAAHYAGDARHLLVVAGAGCGKTKTIIARATHLIRENIPPAQILMLTFTNRAAREMKERLKSEVGDMAFKLYAGTFHGFCLRVMSQAPKSFEALGFTIIDMDDQSALMSLLRTRFIKDSKDRYLKREFPKASELIKLYSYARNTLKSPRDYILNQTEVDESYVDMCLSLFHEYQKEKEARGYMDFDDLLKQFSDMLSKKPELKKAVCTLYNEILVDEMQDTNPLQFSILKHFSSEGVRLFCVGDPAQSIYRFRGAEFEHVYKFSENFENSETLPLSLNYRSRQEILDLSNWLLERSPLKYDANLSAHRGSSGIRPGLISFDNKYEEAGWIAEKAIERKGGGSHYRDMMILVRTGFDAKPIEAELINRGIPYHFIGGISLLKSAHVRDLLALLRVIINKRDDLAWLRFLKLYPRIGEKTAEKVIRFVENMDEHEIISEIKQKWGNLHAAMATYEKAFQVKGSPKEAIECAATELTPLLKDRYDKWHLRVQDFKLLITISTRYDSIHEFVEAFTLEPMTITEIQKQAEDDTLTLITVHSAKGTEAPICFVAGAKSGTYPHLRSYGDLMAEEEERRVLYVALTRAKDELFITRASDYRSGFYFSAAECAGEEYFLESVPNRLTEHEYLGFSDGRGGGLSTLKDIY